MKNIFLSVLLLLLTATSVSNAQITSAATGNWSAPGTWVGGVLPGPTDNVVIADGHKVTLDGNYTVANLTVGGGTSGELNTSKTVVCTLTVTGNIVANAGSTIKPQSSGTGLGSIVQTIILNGNFTFNGASLNLRSGSSSSVPPVVGVLNFVFAGSTNTVISGNGYSLNANAFNAITINKTGGAKVILESTIYILSGSGADVGSQAVLNFLSGVVETGPNTLIHQTNTASNITSGNNSSYVIGNMASALSQRSGLFPVGDAAGYRPILVKSTTAAGNASASGYHWVTVSTISGNANTGTSVFSSDIDKVSAVRYFKITFNKGTNTTAAQMSYNLFAPAYGAGDGVAAGNTNLRVAYSTNERATWTGLSQTAAHTTVLGSSPTTITPDSLVTAITLNDLQSAYVALARVTGTTQNTLTGGTAVEREDGMPDGFSLSQNYPNPFNPSTAISFSIPQSGYVTLKIYDVAGKEVASLLSEEKAAGKYKATFDASRLSTGVYLYRLTAAGSVISRKMTLIK